MKFYVAMFGISERYVAPCKQALINQWKAAYGAEPHRFTPIEKCIGADGSITYNFSIGG